MLNEINAVRRNISIEWNINPENNEHCRCDISIEKVVTWKIMSTAGAIYLYENMNE